MFKYKREIQKAIETLLKNIRDEWDETNEAYIILKRYLKGDNTLTDKDFQILKLQIYDILKLLGLSIPYILIPGSTILLPIILKLAKKYNIKI